MIQDQRIELLPDSRILFGILRFVIEISFYDFTGLDSSDPYACRDDCLWTL